MTNTEAIFKELFAGVMEMSDPAVWTMFAIGGILIWLGVKKDYEPVLLFPMGVGCILANIPGHFAVIPAGGGEPGFLQVLYEAGIANELFPVMIFVAVGAMCDFTPLIRQPYVMLFAAAAHFGILRRRSWHQLLDFLSTRQRRSVSSARRTVRPRFCGAEICHGTSGAPHGDSILLYVPCPDYPAAHYQTADDKAGKMYPHGI